MMIESKTYPATHKVLLSSSDEILVAIKYEDKDEPVKDDDLAGNLLSSPAFVTMGQIYGIERNYKNYGGFKDTLDNYSYQKRDVMIRVDSIIAIYFLTEDVYL